MKDFSDIFEKIDQTQSTNEKVLCLESYFVNADDSDAAWALFFLSGHRLKRLISSKTLLSWCAEITKTPIWLIDECYAAVGDTAECISLLLPREEISSSNNHSLSYWIENLIIPLQVLPPEIQKKHITSYWNELNTKEIFILNKILTGSFRIGVSSLLTLKALANATGVSREILSQRLMGSWEPSKEFFYALKSKEELDKKHLNPYPFYLAYPIDQSLENLGDSNLWLAEWKWDGIRAQAVKRNETVALWSRGNELISHQFPELIDALKTTLDGVVLDGEILAYSDDRPHAFGVLQKRLNRKNVSPSIIKQVPVVFMIYDVLEYNHEDIRSLSLKERRQILDRIVLKHPLLKKSNPLESKDWQSLYDLRLKSKDYVTEGLMLKRLDSKYGTGRQKGNWWKYKVDPMTLDAVLIYAQGGSGIRANLFTDYTFGVFHEGSIIPIAKAYSGLTNREIKELDQWIRKNTEEKFGPVRKVKPFQVFEVAFEAIQLSKRHKSGVALRFPRILRWRKDKPVSEIDSLETIKKTFLL